MAHMYIDIHCYIVSGAVLHGMQHMQLAHQPLWNHDLEFVETCNIITNSRKKVQPWTDSSCSAVYMFPCHFETQRHNITTIIIINLPMGSKQIGFISHEILIPSGRSNTNIFWAVMSCIVASTDVMSRIVASTDVMSCIVASTNVMSHIVASTDVMSHIVASTDVMWCIVASTDVMSRIVASTDVMWCIVASTYQWFDRPTLLPSSWN